jgi:hypothetical protein
MRKLNAFHTISITGIVLSLFAQLLLMLFDKTIPHFWYLYPTWVLVFLFGYLWNVIDKDKGDGHHH